MKRFLQGQTFTPAILQKRNIVNWGILSSLILVFLLSTTSSYANCYGNVNDSGEIGYDQSICAGESVTIENVELPSGGSGTLEYAWLFSTSGPSTDDVDVVTSSSSSFTTGELYETTWIRRCSRRAGCSSWNYGESNWVEISVENGNVSDGGVIAENQTICSGENVTISNVTLPSGGCGEIEYLWLTNTSGAYTNGCDTYASSSASYTFNDLTETTWIRRCSRREGHSSWNYGESNWVKITISSGNVEDGGTIGDNQTICSGDDVTINNVTLPTGGDCDDDIEYLWLSNTAGPDASSATTYASSSSSHTFSNLTETTWIRRCSRREGHSSWSYGESNWLKITVGPCIPNTCNDALVTWSLDACQAYEDAYSYDEFTPEYTSNSDCGTISASTVHRNNPNDYYHSCLVGHDGNAMCVSGTYVDYVPEHSVHRLLFSTTLNEGTTVSGLSFYQKSEEYISNIGSSSATHNNYLTKFSLRAKIDGTLIYESNNNSTSQNGWELSVFDFSSIAALNLSTTTTIDFELVAYDPIENGGSMRAWELDEIKILGCCAATTATIGDVVFNDVNGNGIHDNGETGLEGVIVMLLDADGNMVAQTTTNADGTYSFTDVAAGDYKLKFPATGILNGSTYALTIPNQGNDESVDSDPTVMTGTNDAMTPIFTVNGGDDITDISAGYYFVSTISGFAFEDNNGNGIQNLGDEGLNGITVMLLDENGNMVAQTVTTNGGNYQFENLAPGSYKVKFPENPNINGSTATLTIPNQGSDDNLDSDAVPMNNGSGNAMTQLVTVENGQTIDNLDAGYFTPISIGDKVFEDKNGNGIQNLGDEGIDGITVMLLDENGNMIAQTTTSDGGLYSFDGLAPGNYKVKFPENPTLNGTTLTLTSPNQGADDNLDSDAVPMNNGSGNAMSPIFTVQSGDDNATIDAGYFAPVSIGNKVFEDTNANGIQDAGDFGIDGVVVMLLNENGDMIAQTTTANGGLYTFDGLAPGNYKIKFPTSTTLNGETFSLTLSNQGLNDAIDSDAVPMAGTNDAMTPIVTLQSGDHNQSLDAGYLLTAKIGDTVFKDTNENGLQDPADELFKNVTVTLTGSDVFGNPVSLTTTTDHFGKYSFDQLLPGSYYLTFNPNNPAYIPTIQDALGNSFDEADSDIDETLGRTAPITLSAGENNETIDAGFKYDSSLPVELTSFEAQLVNNNQVVLRWSTASEADNRHFVVERSTDGRDYEPIGVVEGNGTTSLVNHYTLNDTDPFFGYNYYRLKQVDFDGNYEFSHIETVIVSGNDLPDFIMYPNPVIKTTTLRVVTPFEKDTQIEIVNQAGQVLQVVTLEQGANSKQLDLTGYGAGMYYAYINYDGHRTLIYNIVKVTE